MVGEILPLRIFFHNSTPIHTFSAPFSHRSTPYTGGEVESSTPPSCSNAPTTSSIERGVEYRPFHLMETDTMLLLLLIPSLEGDGFGDNATALAYEIGMLCGVFCGCLSLFKSSPTTPSPSTILTLCTFTLVFSFSHFLGTRVKPTGTISLMLSNCWFFSLCAMYIR